MKGAEYEVPHVTSVGALSSRRVLELSMVAIAIFSAVLMLIVADTAWAQGSHADGTLASLGERGLLGAAGTAHGISQGLVVFLVGLVVFVPLVWMPTSRTTGVTLNVGGLFGRGVWVLFGTLVVVGILEMSLFAVRASGEPLGVGLFSQALFDTRTGGIWLARLGLAALVALAATWAARGTGASRWWVATGVGGVLLVTLAQQSHAATEGDVLPLVAAWLHVVAAALWMGGLIGFPLLLLGPLRKVAPDEQSRLRRAAVRRFSKVATIGVMTIIATGLYATLLNVPSFADLIGSAYGRALIMKLGLMVFLLATGGINFMDKGDGPFGRMVGAELVLAIAIFVAAGFLTSLPPAGYGQP